MQVGLWPDTIPNTSTWLGSRGADRKRSSSTSDTRGTFTMHLQPVRMSSLRMSFRSTKGQSEGEAAHLVGLRLSGAFPLQEEAKRAGAQRVGPRPRPPAPASTSAKAPVLPSPGCRQFWPGLRHQCAAPTWRGLLLSGLQFSQLQNGINKWLICPSMQQKLWSHPELLSLTPHTPHPIQPICKPSVLHSRKMQSPTAFPLPPLPLT